MVWKNQLQSHGASVPLLLFIACVMSNNNPHSTTSYHNASHTHSCTPRAPSKRAFTLSRVEQWVIGGHYSRLDHLQFDLLALLRQARQTSGGRGSQVYKDSVAMQRQFVSVRDSVCRNGERLWSPALEYTHR